MVLFGFSNILIKTFVESRYTKEQVTNIILIILTNILRLHIDSILCFFIGSDNYILCITNSIILYFLSGSLFNFVLNIKQKIYSIVRFTINNYDIENYKKWKRYFTIVICMYIYLLTFIVNITSAFIRITLIEYIICFFIIDLIENKYYKKIFIKNDKNLYIYDDQFLLKTDHDISTTNRYNKINYDSNNNLFSDDENAKDENAKNKEKIKNENINNENITNENINNENLKNENVKNENIFNIKNNKKIIHDNNFELN